MNCTLCNRPDAKPRRKHAERVLCARCDERPPLVEWEHPPDIPPATSESSDSEVVSKALTAPLAAQELSGILGLGAVDVRVTGARVVGSGGTASADIYLSNGSVMTFESLRDVATPKLLAVEVAAATGAWPTIKAPAAGRALALLHVLGEHVEAATADELATEWGLSYLQAAAAPAFTIPVIMSDTASRWEAFSEMDAMAPDWMSAPAVGAVLLDNGTRFVRADWFRRYVGHQEPRASARDISSRMMRVGWQRRGTEGRIKATRPGFGDALTWAFLIAPAGWEDKR